MTEQQEPGALADHLLTGMEACIRVSYLQRLGHLASAEKVADEAARLEANLPIPPCSLCPRQVLLEDSLAMDDFVQPAGRPCMLPREILVRALQAAKTDGRIKNRNKIK